MRLTSIRLVIASVLGSVLLAPAIPATAKKPTAPVAPLSCAALTAPDSDLLGTPGVKSAESHLVAAAGQNVAYCQVNILYGENRRPEHQHPRRVAAQLARRRHGRRARRLERQDAGHRRRRLFRQPRGQRARQYGLRGIGHRRRPCRRRLRTRRQPDGTYNLPVHQRLHPQRDEAADPAFEGGRRTRTTREARLQLLERLLDRRTAGLRARAGAAARSSTGFSPTRPRSTGRDSRPRRCGVRS